MDEKFEKLKEAGEAVSITLFDLAKAGSIIENALEHLNGEDAKEIVNLTMMCALVLAEENKDADDDKPVVGKQSAFMLAVLSAKFDGYENEKHNGEEIDDEEDDKNGEEDD